MFPHLAVHNLWWLAAGSAGVAARYAQLRTRTRRFTHNAPADPPGALLRLQELHGYNAHSLVSIAPGSRLWSCPQVAGAITYNEFGRVWLVPGEPLAYHDDLAELTRCFVNAARNEGRLVAFLPTTERFALEAAPLGLRAVKIGAAPYFDLASWGPRGDRAKKARAGVNQARRAGVCVAEVGHIDEKLINETSVLCKSWQKAGRSATRFGWLFAVDLFQHVGRKKFFTARDAEGKLVGFLAASPMPARDGWYLEDVLRLSDAPAGTADLLVVEALNLLKQDGAKLATLGLSPLARDGSVDPRLDHNDRVANAVRMVTRCFVAFYNFEGLHRFKTKFAPSWWESEYILLPREVRAPPLVISAFIQAIAPGGASKLVAQQFVRALQPLRFKEKHWSENRSQGVVVEDSAVVGSGRRSGYEQGKGAA